MSVTPTRTSNPLEPEVIGRNICEGTGRSRRGSEPQQAALSNVCLAACGYRLRSFDMTETRILLAIDDSLASARAVTYAAHVVGRRRGFRFCVVHVLPSFPAHLLEHGGSETSARDLTGERQLWLAAAKNASQTGLDEARAKLRKAGVPTGAIQLLFCEPAEGRDAADDILQMAHECKCDTVVVGRDSVSWFHELFSQELSEEILRRGKGFSVWAIE